MEEQTEILIPGTAQLVDAQGLFHGLHNQSHGHGMHAQHACEIVLVPQPTDDPQDPLRWTPPRKMQAMVVALMWCFFVAATISGLSPAYLLIEKDTGISVADLSTGNGIMFLFLGWGTMLSQTLALACGRRPTLVVSVLLTSAVTVWTAYVKSRGEFYINRVFLGIMASPQETLIEVIVGDLFFAHERGFYMGAYSWTLWCGAFLCPVASGYVAQSLGWRWIQYILAIICAGVGLITFFGFEETMFYRPAQNDYHAHEEAVDDMGEHRPAGASLSASNLEDESTMARMTTPGITEKPRLSSDVSPSQSSPSPSTAVTLPTSHPYASSLKLWGFRDARQPPAFSVFFLPLRLLIMLPGVGFGGLLVGGILAWYNVVGGSLALILGYPPYNFSTNEIGLTYLACVVGVTIGCLLSGWAADALAVILSRRNNGVLEPEQRLWSSLVALVLHPVGCLLYGVGASYHIHWFAIIVGLCCIGVTLPMGANLAFTYLLDSYKEVSGEGLVSIILVRNMMGKLSFPFSSPMFPPSIPVR